jgi:hypothetical protein
VTLHAALSKKRFMRRKGRTNRSFYHPFCCASRTIGLNSV